MSGERSAGALLNATARVSPQVAGRMAFWLFRRPLRRGAVLPAERPVHERARRGELTVRGKRVVTYRWGDGSRPVLLLHGWQSRVSRFAAFVPQLEALGLSPVGFDAPGHGDSGGRATTILEYRQVIGRLQERYGTFHSVIAHSFGATCAFFALREGTAAGRLVAVSPVSSFGFLRDEFGRMLRLTPRLREDLRRRIEDQLFPEVVDVWARFDATHRPSEVAVPDVLLVHDTEDGTVPLEQARLLHQAYAPRVRLVTTTGLGHRRILAQPAVTSPVLDYLSTAPN